MSLPITSIRIIGHVGDLCTVAAKAALQAFPHALVTRTDELSDILGKDFAAGTELLVLLAPAGADLDRATAALDARGWPRWAVVACSPVPGGLDSHAISVTPEDWTEPMLELALVTAVRLQTMKSANVQLCGDMRTLSRRLGHDLRSPLHCIATASQAMLADDEGPGSPQAAFARSIADSVDEVVELFERMSFVMKATTNPPSRQPVIMEEIVWGALQRLESRMLKAGVTVSKPPKWPVVEGIPAWLDVIWSNLLTNILKHAGPKPHIELGWEQLPDGHRFWVRDHGAGVPAKQTRQLFHPLDRLSELNAPRGLGLPIVHRLVELQGGRCGHDPSSGGSATFYFTLPSAVG